MIEIRKITDATRGLLWTVEDRRLDSERVIVRAKQGGFEIDYKALPGALWRVGNTRRGMPEPAWEGDDPDKDIYLAWLDDKPAGQILLEGYEHNLALIRDIRVEMTMRRRGVGEAMLALAEDWARAKGFHGLMAETQDVNAGACQFFTRCGFELGGVDMLRYVARSQQTMMATGLRESALFFYKFFRS
ncbi:MAG: GNAT family N-acetyltransferase [Firmicutes bacterium]|nr:GNAT family N-acetyltransferase [Bacillota bacterium]